MQYRAQLFGGEVMPQTVRAGQQRVADLKLRDVVRGQLGLGFGAEATEQHVRFGVNQRLIVGQLALVNERLHIRMVLGAPQQRRPAKVVQA